MIESGPNQEQPPKRINRRRRRVMRNLWLSLGACVAVFLAIVLLVVLIPAKGNGTQTEASLVTTTSAAPFSPTFSTVPLPLQAMGETQDLMNQGKYAEAITACDKYIQVVTDPEVVAALWRTKGDAMFGLKDYNGALTAYDKAVSITPKDTDSLLGEGLALVALKRYQESVDCFKQVESIDPKNQEARLCRSPILSHSFAIRAAHCFLSE